MTAEQPLKPVPATAPVLLEVERAFPAPGTRPCGLAWDGRSLWQANAGAEALFRIDPDSGATLQRLACPDVRADLAVAGGVLWQIAGWPKALRLIDPDSAVVVDELPLGVGAEAACGLYVEDGAVWIGWQDTGLIERRDANAAVVLGRYPATMAVAGLARAGGTLWFTDGARSLLVGIDLSTGGEAARYRLPGSPTGLCWDGSRFWYNDTASRRIVAVRVPEGE